MEEIGKHISTLHRHIQSEMARRLEPSGIGTGQYPYLIAVCRRPGISQEALSALLTVNKSTVARAIAALEQDGYLRRDPLSSARRRYSLYPTEKGRAAARVTLHHLSACSETLTEGLSEEEKSAAALLLERMAENIQRQNA